jgi:acetyl-CoA carboxylase biotin carboxyl carrier protein
MRHAIVAELVGNVHSVLVQVGDAVAEGDTIVILESMKMEIPVLTEFAGTVVDVDVAAGVVVQEGDVLAVIEVVA